MFVCACVVVQVCSSPPRGFLCLEIMPRGCIEAHDLEVASRLSALTYTHTQTYVCAGACSLEAASRLSVLTTHTLTQTHVCVGAGRLEAASRWPAPTHTDLYVYMHRCIYKYVYIYVYIYI